MLTKNRRLNRFNRAEWFTAISVIGILVILILILGLCFAIFCLCHRERKHHYISKQSRSSDVCLKQLPDTCTSKSPFCSCPRDESYQETYVKEDCKNQVEPENKEYHLCASRNDHYKYHPEFTACELICPEINTYNTTEDLEDSTSTESCDELFVDKCDAECQSNFQASRVPSEDTKSCSIASCSNKVEEVLSNIPMIQSRASAEIMTYDDLFASTSSSQSSYQEYLSSLPSDISTPRSESSSQISLNSEIADDFVNNSECSVISSMPSEALINLMQSYFANSDDVKSVKISILLDKSQTDDLSHTSNVEENANESSCQTNSPSDSEQYSRIGLKGKCGFLHGGNNSTDVEPSFASVENSETCSSSLDSQEFVHFDSQIPSIVGRSSDWYCADDKEPCSKTTTVRYVFTDSENEV